MDNPSLRLPTKFTDLVEVGRGTTGVVYRAMYTKRVVAVKVPLLSADEGRRALEALWLEREAQVLAREPDRNVPAIYEVGVHHDQRYYVRAFVEGDSLECRGLSNGIGLREGLRALLSVAETVARFHARGIAHRTLEPSNVLIGKDGKPWLIGFGRTRMLGPSIGDWEELDRAAVRSDVVALRVMLGWLYIHLGEPLPPALQPAGVLGSVSSASDFAAAVQGYLDGAPA